MFILAKFEAGLHHYVYDLSLIQLEGRFVNMQIYSDLNEFIEIHSAFNDLTLTSLRVSFGALLLCEMLAIFLFLSRRPFKRPKKIHSLGFAKIKYDRNVRRYMGRSDFQNRFY